METKLYFLLGLFVTLQLADYVTTVKALSQPDWYESNKFLASLMTKIGMKPALVLFKLIPCLALGGLTYWFINQQITSVFNFWAVLLLLLDVYYAVIVYNNSHNGN